MMNFLANLVAWINVPMNFMGRHLLAFIAVMPGWLSNTIISAVMAVVILIIIKYTSNQQAIGRAKDTIKANLLALKLFKDDMMVTIQSQGLVFLGSFKLLFYNFRPMLVMIIPVSLIMAQMNLWYQSQPLPPGQQAVITMKLNSQPQIAWPDVVMQPNAAWEITSGPFHIESEHEICWEIKAIQDGYHDIVFQVGQEKFNKQLAVGNGFMRVSTDRPSRNWSDMLYYPQEKPFAPQSVVQSINIEYPDRTSYTSGTDWWLIYFFGVSMIFALICKPVLKVKI